MKQNVKIAIIKISVIYCNVKWSVSHPLMSNSLWPPPGSSIHGFIQERILGWGIAIPFSRGSSSSKDWTWVSYIVGRFFTFEPQGKPQWESHFVTWIRKVLGNDVEWREGTIWFGMKNRFWRNGLFSRMWLNKGLTLSLL